MQTDPIADYLTRIRNAIMRGHKTVSVPASKMKIGITKVLYDMGYIKGYKIVKDPERPYIREIIIALKYHPVTKEPAIHQLKRISRPGLRKYSSVKKLKSFRNNLGILILSTPKGIIHDKEARKYNVGGEVLCSVW